MLNECAHWHFTTRLVVRRRSTWCGNEFYCPVIVKYVKIIHLAPKPWSHTVCIPVISPLQIYVLIPANIFEHVKVARLLCWWELQWPDETQHVCVLQKCKVTRGYFSATPCYCWLWWETNVITDFIWLLKFGCCMTFTFELSKFYCVFSDLLIAALTLLVGSFDP